MLDQIEGSQAVAHAVACCRPQVVCAYPITPQTHIVEALGRRVRDGSLAPCEFVNVESEFAAMSVAIGASAAGSRAYTATASQGLLYMAEAVYNAAGLGLPVVMTVANRAIGAPINIWNDHSDAMALRDAGWVQLYASDNQEAVDLHPLAFRLAETLSVPVMVCADGFTLTHAFERIDLPAQEQVDRYLPALVPRQRLDPDAPVTIGAMVGPEAFTEVRYLADRQLRHVLELIPGLSAELARELGRACPGLARGYHLEEADTVVVAQGSVVGTLLEVTDDLRADGGRVGLLAINTYRPFPFEVVRSALSQATRVVVIDRALATGMGGFLVADVRPTLAPGTSCTSVVAGLGGRPISRSSLRYLLDHASDDRPDRPIFLDLNHDLIREQGGGT